MIFHRFWDVPNLDFCNTLQRFSRFFNISANRSKDTSQAPKKLQNTSQMPPKCYQNPPNSLPRPFQEPPRAPKSTPRDPKIRPAAPKITQIECLGAFQRSKMRHKRLQEASKSFQVASKSFQEASKRLPRGFQWPPRGPQRAPSGLRESAKCLPGGAYKPLSYFSLVKPLTLLVS